MTLISEMHFLPSGTCRRNIEPQGDPKQFGEGQLYIAKYEKIEPSQFNRVHLLFQRFLITVDGP
jgi:hypothetical protein